MTATTDLTGKTILITGATRGIGKITATNLAGMGARLVITGRDPQICARVAAELSQMAPHKVDWLAADLSSMDEVRRMAGEFRQRYDHLDVLVNNAGGLFMERKLTPDNLEMTFALNHLSYFLLSHLLYDLLVKAGRGRIINMSSIAHIYSRLNFSNLDNHRFYVGWVVYGQTKLMNLYFTYEMARRLNGSGPTVNAVHPGFVTTNFALNNGGIFHVFYKTLQVLSISLQQGAATPTYLASSPDVEGVTGRYFVGCRPVSSSPLSYHQETARRLWEISARLTGV